MKIIILHDNGTSEEVGCRCAMVIATKNNVREPSVEYTGKIHGVYSSGDPEAMARVAGIVARRYEEIARGGI